MTSTSTALTWHDLIRLEPHLEVLAERVRHVDKGYPSFCRRSAWLGFDDLYVQAQFYALVGPARLALEDYDDERLYTESAVEVAFERIWNAMPPCRNCEHTAVEQSSIEALRAMPYADYLKTTHWRTVRAAAIERAGYACQVCRSGKRLNVHHNSYARLGCEEREDVIVLCETCHGLFHREGRLAR